MDFSAVPIGIIGWEIAIDAAADLVAFRSDVDGLGYGQVAAALDDHIAVEAEDAFVGLSSRGQCREQQPDQGEEAAQLSGPRGRS